MLARDIMHWDVVTVTPETPLGEIARLLVERRFGAVPVTNETGVLVGIVSEADLLHREELGTERRRNRWIDAFASIETLANAYRSAHGLLARDVMARSVVTASPDASLAEIVELMERCRFRRVPIVEARPDGSGQLVGIVTRGDLVRALGTLVPASPARPPIGPSPTGVSATCCWPNSPASPGPTRPRATSRYSTAWCICGVP